MFRESLERREVAAGRKARDAAANLGFQIRCGAAPVRSQESIRAIVGNRHGHNLPIVQNTQQTLDGRETLPISLEKPGK